MYENLLKHLEWIETQFFIFWIVEFIIMRWINLIFFEVDLLRYILYFYKVYRDLKVIH
jgi:hypothetical protein